MKTNKDVVRAMRAHDGLGWEETPGGVMLGLGDLGTLVLPTGKNTAHVVKGGIVTWGTGLGEVARPLDRFALHLLLSRPHLDHLDWRPNGKLDLGALGEARALEHEGQGRAFFHNGNTWTVGPGYADARDVIALAASAHTGVRDVSSLPTGGNDSLAKTLAFLSKTFAAPHHRDPRFTLHERGRDIPTDDRAPLRTWERCELAWKLDLGFLGTFFLRHGDGQQSALWGDRAGVRWTTLIESTNLNDTMAQAERLILQNVATLPPSDWAKANWEACVRSANDRLCSRAYYELDLGALGVWYVFRDSVSSISGMRYRSRVACGAPGAVYRDQAIQQHFVSIDHMLQNATAGIRLRFDKLAGDRYAMELAEARLLVLGRVPDVLAPAPSTEPRTTALATKTTGDILGPVASSTDYMVELLSRATARIAAEWPKGDELYSSLVLGTERGQRFAADQALVGEMSAAAEALSGIAGTTRAALLVGDDGKRWSRPPPFVQADAPSTQHVDRLLLHRLVNIACEVGWPAVQEQPSLPLFFFWISVRTTKLNGKPGHLQIVYGNQGPILRLWSGADVVTDLLNTLLCRAVPILRSEPSEEKDRQISFILDKLERLVDTVGEPAFTFVKDEDLLGDEALPYPRVISAEIDDPDIVFDGEPWAKKPPADGPQPRHPGEWLAQLLNELTFEDRSLRDKEAR